MLNVDETVDRIQEQLRTIADGESVALFEDGRLAVVPLARMREPASARAPGDPAPIEYFVPGGEIPDEEIRDRLNTALHAEPRRTIQGG